MFRASEVFAFARAMEEKGRAFYQAMADGARDDKVRRLFERLALEEARHIRDFDELASTAAPYDPPESYPGEYEAYMQALVDSNIFPKDIQPEALAGQIGSDKEALNFAIQLEKEALLFFSGLKNLVSLTETSLIDELLRQERRHLCELHSALEEVQP
ncbi:ferritin-like domain-containing protein [Thermanaeromonas sp. C210]|uniref:ferritin-like domain-containing protein n=1 Tax=Thermanaeromonas sp. C210 TaxID=2731925 RepID=UPI00155C3BFB|nr:ferritin family protein [Thermanaeromonas sp. C210]GFN23977.1 hypothetical protein TAMC210_22940 [Thermanaeromonas sp. C210]